MTGQRHLGGPIVVPLRVVNLWRYVYVGLSGNLGLTWILVSIYVLAGVAPITLVLVVASLGVLPLALAAFLALRRRVPAPNVVVLEPAGIRWSKGPSSWGIPWTDLATASIESSKPPGGQALDGPRLSTVWARIDLYPADSDFPRGHPELAPFWEAAGAKGCYRLPLGQVTAEIRELDAGMRAYAQDRYRGITFETSRTFFRDQ